MERISVNNDGAIVKLSRVELLIINNALGEMWNCLDIIDFTTRIGATEQEVEETRKNINKLLRESRDAK